MATQNYRTNAVDFVFFFVCHAIIVFCLFYFLAQTHNSVWYVRHSVFFSSSNCPHDTCKQILEIMHCRFSSHFFRTFFDRLFLVCRIRIFIVPFIIQTYKLRADNVTILPFFNFYRKEFHWQIKFRSKIVTPAHCSEQYLRIYATHNVCVSVWKQLKLRIHSLHVVFVKIVYCNFDFNAWGFTAFRLNKWPNSLLSILRWSIWHTKRTKKNGKCV